MDGEKQHATRYAGREQHSRRVQVYGVCTGHCHDRILHQVEREWAAVLVGCLSGSRRQYDALSCLFRHFGRAGASHGHRLVLHMLAHTRCYNVTDGCHVGFHRTKPGSRLDVRCLELGVALGRDVGDGAFERCRALPDCVVVPEKKHHNNKYIMGFKLIYTGYWIRDVFWLGTPAPKAPKVLGAKYISNPDVAPF